jgi:alkanesulfonate monooxygenase SsuD/methylene tetrahydromethanopterin reductase-like flavin-dependent oxidoreductase (luciferase family)
LKFGITYHSGYFGVDPDNMVASAKHAEDAGFESFYLPEHIVLYPGAMVGSIVIDPSLPFLDPLACLGFVAAATERIVLGTAVLQLPYHHPVILAKRLATLDVLSKGRMRLLTVGLGSLPGEAIDILRILWAGDKTGVSYQGEFFRFTSLVSFPKPHHARTLPIHVGGSTRAAARRAGLRGDGYFPGGRIGSQERALQIELMRTTAREAGRDAEKLEVTRWGSIEMSEEDLQDFKTAGTTRLVVSATELDPQAQREEISAFAQRLNL